MTGMPGKPQQQQLQQMQQKPGQRNQSKNSHHLRVGGKFVQLKFAELYLTEHLFSGVVVGSWANGSTNRTTQNYRMNRTGMVSIGLYFLFTNIYFNYLFSDSFSHRS